MLINDRIDASSRRNRRKGLSSRVTLTPSRPPVFWFCLRRNELRARRRLSFPLRTASGRGSTTDTVPFVMAFNCSLPRAER